MLRTRRLSFPCLPLSTSPSFLSSPSPHSLLWLPRVGLPYSLLLPPPFNYNSHSKALLFLRLTVSLCLVGVCRLMSSSPDGTDFGYEDEQDTIHDGRRGKEAGCMKSLQTMTKPSITLSLILQNSKSFPSQTLSCVVLANLSRSQSKAENNP